MRISSLTISAARKVCHNYQTRECSLSVTVELEPGESAGETAQKLAANLQNLVDNAVGDTTSPHSFASTRLEREQTTASSSPSPA